MINHLCDHYRNGFLTALITQNSFSVSYNNMETLLVRTTYVSFDSNEITKEWNSCLSKQTTLISVCSSILQQREFAWLSTITGAVRWWCYITKSHTVSLCPCPLSIILIWNPYNLQFATTPWVNTPSPARNTNTFML